MQNRKSKVQSGSRKNSAPLLILISAPSGGGQDDVVQSTARGAAGHDARHHLHHARAASGRKGRRGLLFFQRGGILRREQAGEFIEHATVYGNSYGILKSELLGKLRSGRDVLLNVDVQGAATIRGRVKTEPELKRALVTVFLTPPSIAVLEERLKNARGGFGGGHPKTARGGAAGNRAMEKFRLSADQRHEAGGFAADAGDCRGGENAGGADGGAGVLKLQICRLRIADLG